MTGEVKSQEPQKNFSKLRKAYKPVRDQAKQTTLQLSQLPGSQVQPTWKYEKEIASGMMAVNKDVQRVHEEELKKTEEIHAEELKKIVDEKARAQEEGRTDEKTGLLNERGFKERLRAEIDRSLREGEVLGLLELDLDNLKVLNDTYGHEKGDEAIRIVADSINNHLEGKKSVTREIDIAARVGGDEFFIILPDIKDGIELAGGRIRLAIEERLKTIVPLEMQGERPTVSMGATTFFMNPEDAPKEKKELHEKILAETPGEMRIQADIALYVSKNGGKNRLTIYREGMTMPQNLQKNG